MRNSIKVAKWEIKRNLKNKSYIIGLFMTPLIFLVFMLISSFMSGSEDDTTTEVTDVYINDQVELFDEIEETVKTHELNWQIHQTDLDKASLEHELASSEDTAYLFLTEEEINQDKIPVFTSEDIPDTFMNEVQFLEGPIKLWQAKKLGLSDDELAVAMTPLSFNEWSVDDLKETSSPETKEEHGTGLSQAVPGIFGGLILLSISITGMYIFQSASNEKKDKIAEIILSSVTPGELMQGKIVGYFVLGLIQVAVILVFAVPMALWKLDFPVLDYLLVPQTLLFILIAIMGYLLFASLFVGLGATMADMGSAGNFQGFVMMLPFLPFIFITPVIGNPSGLIAKVGTYFPFSTPGVLMLRLVMLEEWPWLEIGIALVILALSIWLFMKLAGKIFKVGILMYGKNATPKEIWRWLRA